MKEGNWEFFPDNLTIYNKSEDYEIDLEDMTTSAEVLNWIFQIASKADAKGFDLTGMVALLKRVVHSHFGNSAQGVFCPGGGSMIINWAKKQYSNVIMRKFGTTEARNKRNSEMLQLYKHGHSYSFLMNKFGLSRSAVYQAIKKSTTLGASANCQ